MPHEILQAGTWRQMLNPRQPAATAAGTDRASAISFFMAISSFPLPFGRVPPRFGRKRKRAGGPPGGALRPAWIPFRYFSFSIAARTALLSSAAFTSVFL